MEQASARGNGEDDNSDEESRPSYDDVAVLPVREEDEYEELEGGSSSGASGLIGQVASLDTTDSRESGSEARTDAPHAGGGAADGRSQRQQQSTMCVVS